MMTECSATSRPYSRLALTIYCLVDAIQTDDRSVCAASPRWRGSSSSCSSPSSVLPRVLAGRPPRGPRDLQQRPRPRGPDDDPDFLKDL